MPVQQNHSFMSPLRYPGGKGALANFMKAVVAQNSLMDGDYVEVYAGGAGIAWPLLFEEYVHHVHINDLSKAIMAFWRSIVEYNDDFCRLVVNTPVTMDEWYRQQEVQIHPKEHSIVEVGFSTFFLNRTNRSGILKGGVIGGKGQTGRWKLDARFNRPDLVQRIQRIGKYANRISLYNLDATDFIQSVLPDISRKTLVYLDPPYFNKGQELYENHYGRQDHVNIAKNVVNYVKQPWIISYDAAPEILEIYKEHRNIQYSIRYSAGERYAGAEVVIFKHGLQVPDVDNPTAMKMPTFQRTLM